MSMDIIRFHHLVTITINGKIKEDFGISLSWYSVTKFTVFRLGAYTGLDWAKNFIKNKSEKINAPICLLYVAYGCIQ